MKNRRIILTAILSLLVCGGLSRIGLAADSAPVTVVNTTTNPVPIVGTVQDAESHARNAVIQWLAFGESNGSSNGGGRVTIPAGKIFVLEYASFAARVYGGPLLEVQIQVVGPSIDGVPGPGIFNLVVPPPTVASSNFSFTTGGQSLRLYAPPQSSLTVSFITNATFNSATLFQMSLSGYFVNAQ